VNQISGLNPPVHDRTFEICGEDLVQNYFALCVGDFSRNFIPAAGTKNSSFMASDLQLVTAGNIIAGEGSTIMLPVMVTSDLEIGAVSLVLDIPADLAEVEGVFLKSGTEQDLPGRLDWSLDGRILRIGWNSLTPIDFKAGENLVTLKLRTTAEFVMGKTIQPVLVEDPLNELADGQFETISGAELHTFAVEASAYGVNEPGSAEIPVSLTCRPNPFYDFTDIHYSLPVQGEVTLDIVNKYGARVARLVDGYQENGWHQIKVDGSALNPGVYTVTLTFRAKGDVQMKSIKIVRGW
jgi:hypothetical protein